jgi:hypothetical protein
MPKKYIICFSLFFGAQTGGLEKEKKEKKKQQGEDAFALISCHSRNARGSLS